MYACPVFIEGGLYPTVENAYQALKFSDPKIRMQIADMTPIQAKQFAKDNPIDDLSDFDRLVIMYRVLSIKFLGNRSMMKLLLNTENAELIEGNNQNDTFWGVYNDNGLNHLGRMLMNIRGQIIVNVRGDIL